jgi:N-acetylmuramoyl-L-alanine amidase
MRWFRTPAEVRAESHPLDKPLSGLRVAIDPGHIGGPWAQMEERAPAINGSAPVQEGDLNLITGRLLKAGIDRLGATVFKCATRPNRSPPTARATCSSEARELLAAHSGHATNLRRCRPTSSISSSATGDGPGRISLLPLLRNQGTGQPHPE